MRKWLLFSFLMGLVGGLDAEANGNVHVSRFWHNHQPIYWPEWNSNGGQDQRVQYAWDSIVLKPGQNYGGLSPKQHPENNLTDIFGIDDRKNSYQGGPRNSLNTFSGGGFALSYSGSLIDNVRQLGSVGQLGYGNGWADGNREAKSWGRLDLVGFTYHHSLAPLLPKSVFRKEIQIFKQAWWKAWDGNADLSDHSKGFFPTEMAYTRDMIDVLVDEGYEWVIVASHHISRTSPSYNSKVDPEGSYNIFSSPPNKADQVGPVLNDGWWYGQPNPGNAAWNVSPYAYQLHKVKYVNPNTGAEKTMIAVPSDDVLSYRFGYANEGISKIQSFIAPFATDPNRPVIVMPSSDGDNAWGGGSSSWMESTPQYFNDSANAGYQKDMPGSFVNAYKQYATLAHIEDGAWIFPEMDYGSPYFLKWIEPPVNPKNLTNCYPGTIVDLETPGFALKFYSYAPLMAGANWCETAEQIWRDDGGTVEPWKIQAPYDWNGTWNNPNVVELAWHIYLAGLDSGFNYYGGLGNDDEVKPSLATRRAVEKLQGFLPARLADDRTPPTVLKPQRFPYNPGAYTFGWFNSIPGVDTRFLKKMPSEFYIWTHAYDVSGVTSVNVKIRKDHDGVRSLANNDNVTYAGGPDVGPWTTIPMTKRVLSKDRATLNALADNGQIDFFITSPEIADYYFVKITDANLSDFRGKLLDFYVEATDARGNVHKSEIQHVYVEDDGEGGAASSVTFSDNPRDCDPLVVTFRAEGGDLEGVSPVYQQISFDSGTTWSNHLMTAAGANGWVITNAVPDNAPSAIVWFQDTGGALVDSNGGNNWSTSIQDCDTEGPREVIFDPANPDSCTPVTIRYYPKEGVLQTATNIYIHIGRNGWQDVIEPGPVMTQNGYYWEYTYVTPTNTALINVAFNDGGSIWDSNGGSNWNVTVTNCGEVEPPLGVVTIDPPAPNGCGPITITYNPSGRDLIGASPVYIHVGRNGWDDVIQPDPAMTQSGSYWTYVYNPLPGTTNINVVFNNGGSTWDNNDDTDWSFTVTGCDALPSGLLITNPPSDIAVSNAVSTYDVSGVGDSVIGQIHWTNSLNGTSGFIAAQAGWIIPGVPLGVGGNAITVSGTNMIMGGVTTNAADSATGAAYDSGWVDGNNAGSGFGNWTLNPSPATGGAGWFVGAAGAIGRSWGLYSNNTNLSEVIRPFVQPLSSGQTFRVQLQNGWVKEEGGGIGVALQTAEGDTLWQFFFNGGDTNYSRSGGTTDLAWTEDGLDVAFTLTDDDSYEVRITPLGGSESLYSGSVAGTVARFRAWSYNNGSGENYDFFVNHLRITSPSLSEGETFSHTRVINRIGDPWKTDSNADGIPDGWYQQYGHDPFGPSISTNDWDEDGFDSRAEALLGTDPYSAASGLFMESIASAVNGQPTIAWMTVGGRRYEVQYSDDLTQPGGGFLLLDTEEETSVGFGVQTSRTVIDANPPTEGMRHYRVRFVGLVE